MDTCKTVAMRMQAAGAERRRTTPIHSHHVMNTHSPKYIPHITTYLGIGLSNRFLIAEEASLSLSLVICM